MATDSALLSKPPPPRQRPLALTPRSGPIARTVGLDAPFFADKNRAFWVLQSAGWIGYFMLRTLSGIANAVPAMFVVHTLLLTATGYSLTLLLATLYRRLITMRAIYTVILSLAAVGLASGCFSVIETWSHATFVRPGANPVGVQLLGADPAQFRAARGLVGALLRDQLLPAAGRGDRPAHAA